MGLYGHLLLVPPALPHRLAHEPALLDAVLFDDDFPGELRDGQGSGEIQLSLWPEGLADNGPLVERLDIDRAWHVLHFLLADSADAEDHPLSFLAAGGRAISEDLGNGPLRAFTPTHVRSLADGLARVMPEQLLERFDPLRLEEEGIYGWPEGWQEATLATCAPFLLEAFLQTREFLERGGARGRALLVYSL